MKRVTIAMVSALMIGLAVAGLAHAASAPGHRPGGHKPGGPAPTPPPVVFIRAAKPITAATAVLHGAVNTRGVATGYIFNYGPTPALGMSSAAGHAGHRRGRAPVAKRITGLMPGTTYYFDLRASNAVATVTSTVGTFTTAGPPPSSVYTGPAGAVYEKQALLTGSINPNGGAIRYYFQYGPTTAYGKRTSPQRLAPATTAVSVRTTVKGLAPAKLYHYRVVAVDGTALSYGGDNEFYTQPTDPPPAGLHTKTTPGADATRPYTFTTSGSLTGAPYILAGERCSGNVRIRYYSGSHQVAYQVPTVGSDCTFSASVNFKKKHARGKVPIRVTVTYRGNGFLAPEHRTDHVTAG